MDKNKEYGNLKVLIDTLKKFRQAKRLREFKMDESITISEFIEIILEREFKRYDDKIIKRVDDGE